MDADAKGELVMIGNLNRKHPIVPINLCCLNCCPASEIRFRFLLSVLHFNINEENQEDDCLEV